MLVTAFLLKICEDEKRRIQWYLKIYQYILIAKKPVNYSKLNDFVPLLDLIDIIFLQSRFSFIEFHKNCQTTVYFKNDLRRSLNYAIVELTRPKPPTKNSKVYCNLVFIFSYSSHTIHCQLYNCKKLNFNLPRHNECHLPSIIMKSHIFLTLNSFLLISTLCT